MRILHLCLSCFYIDGYNYQENILPRINKDDGHDVKIIASTETFVNNKKLGYLNPKSYFTEYGVEIVRIPYFKIFTKTISAKIRIFKGLTKEIEAFMPDIIFSHDLSYVSVVEVRNYVKKNPKVRFYADTHASALNSGRNLISLYFLHRFVYRLSMKRVFPYLQKYYYITEYEKRFSIENYQAPEGIMEFFPLGGEVLDEKEYLKKRDDKRKELGIKNDEILLVHSGKLNAEKKTGELIKAFINSKLDNAKLIIIGSILDDYHKEISELIQLDSRVEFLGWKKTDELQAYLCAADLYCQPGSESSTMENAVCCRCPVLVRKGASYSYGEDYGNLIWIETVQDIINVLNQIHNNSIDLKEMSKKSLLCAKDILDYRILASRYY